MVVSAGSVHDKSTEPWPPDAFSPPGAPGTAAALGAGAVGVVGAVAAVGVAEAWTVALQPALALAASPIR